MISCCTSYLDMTRILTTALNQSNHNYWPQLMLTISQLAGAILKTNGDSKFGLEIHEQHSVKLLSKFAIVEDFLSQNSSNSCVFFTAIKQKNSLHKLF